MCDRKGERWRVQLVAETERCKDMTPPVSAPALAGLCWNIHDSPVTLIYSVSLSGEMYVVRRRVMHSGREKDRQRKKQRRIRARMKERLKAVVTLHQLTFTLLPHCCLSNCHSTDVLDIPPACVCACVCV